MSKQNELLPFLDELCKHVIIPRYGQPMQNGFTTRNAYELLESKNIHYNRRTVERKLNELVNAGILEKRLSGREMAFRRSKNAKVV